MRRDSSREKVHLLASFLQHPGYWHPLQRDHHPADDVQHLRVPGGPGVAAAAEIQGSAGGRGRLPHPQHLLPLLDDGASEADR